MSPRRRTKAREPITGFIPYAAPRVAASPPTTTTLPKDLASRDAFTSPRASGRRKAGGMDDDDVEDGDSDVDADQGDKLVGKQQIGLFEDAISLEQVRFRVVDCSWGKLMSLRIGKAYCNAVDLADACVGGGLCASTRLVWRFP